MSEQVRIEGALFDINARWDLLSDSERKIAAYVLKEPKKTLHFNVRELARQSGSSQAAVIRFCRHMGFESFSNFKLRIARDVFGNSDERYIPALDLESESSPASVKHQVIDRIHRSLGALEKVLDSPSLELVVDTILKAGTTTLFGVGASSVVAWDFMQKLIRLGLPVFYTQDTDLQLTVASTMRPGDCAFIISYSGENNAMIEVAQQVGEKNVPLVSLTSDTENTVRSKADIPLLVPVSERIYRQGASTSRIDQLAVIDMLYSLLVSRNLEASIDAIEHTMAITHRNSSKKRR